MHRHPSLQWQIRSPSSFKSWCSSRAGTVRCCPPTRRHSLRSPSCAFASRREWRCHHPVINAGVLLSGQAIETVSGATLHLKAGDPIVETVNMAHYGVNDGAVPAEIIVVYAGTVDHPITVVEKP